MLICGRGVIIFYFNQIRLMVVTSHFSCLKILQRYHHHSGKENRVHNIEGPQNNVFVAIFDTQKTATDSETNE